MSGQQKISNPASLDNNFLRTTRVNGASSEVSLAESTTLQTWGPRKASTDRASNTIKGRHISNWASLGTQPVFRLCFLFMIFYYIFATSCAVTQTSLDVETYTRHTETSWTFVPLRRGPPKGTSPGNQGQGTSWDGHGNTAHGRAHQTATSPDKIEQHPRPASEPATQTIMAVPCPRSATERQQTPLNRPPARLPSKSSVTAPACQRTMSLLCPALELCGL